MEGVTIRAYEAEDVPAVTRLFNQRRVAAGTLQVPFTGLAERAERYRMGPDVRMVVAEHDGRVIGHAALHLHSGRRKHTGEIGMGVDESYQGMGVGSKLLEALLDLADNWYNVSRVELHVYADNAAAIHLYEKFGFQREGLHREYAFREGQFVDAVSMARLRSDRE